MEKKQGFQKNRKRLVILVVVVIAVAVVVFIFNQLQKNILGSLTEAPPELYMLERTSLESKVTASGNFETMDPVTIGSNVQYGEVSAVYVSVGDQVYAGDVLATLKTTDILRDIKETQATISDSVKSDNQKVSSAQRALNEARDQYNIDLYQNNQEIANAQAEYDRLVNGIWWSYNNAKATYEAKKAEYEAKKAEYEADPTNTTLKTEMDALEIDMKALEVLVQPAYDQCQAEYNKQYNAVLVAQEAVNKATNLRDSTARNDNIRILDAQDQLNSVTGQDSARQTRTQLESLNEDLSNATIVSTITGIVTAVSTEAGKASSGDMFVVEYTETLQVTATIAEYDVIKVAPGMSAHVSSNALDDEEFDAVVEYVAPVAADTNGNFEVRVTLTSAIGQLRPGMTATVEIVTASKENIFSVPIDAVVTKPNGTKVVYAYEMGNMLSFDTQSMPEVQAAPEDQANQEGLTMPEGQTLPEGAIGGGPIPIDGSGGPDGTQIVVSGSPGNVSTGSSGTRREIVVTTGMETDYYIEISSDELTEGMLILADPEGKNVVPAGGMDQLGMMGGGTVTVEDNGGAAAARVPGSGPTEVRVIESAKDEASKNSAVRGE